MSINKQRIRIVTRKSALALQQAKIVQQSIQTRLPEQDVEIIPISTRGDDIMDIPLNKIGGKGLFISELEEYLLQDRADIAVHSMKDLPSEITKGLAIGAMLPRADPRDVLLSKDFASIKELPANSIVGTSSLRRQAQILALNHHVIVEPLRGNVDTRINKLIDGKYSAIILAAAGLDRLGLNEWLKNPIETSEMLPAVGQGAIGVQYNTANTAVKRILVHIDDHITTACVRAERAMNKLLDGGCSAPIAGYATCNAEQLTLHGLVAEPNGTFIMTDMQSAPIHAAEDLGARVAMQLITEGAADVIAKAKQQQQNTW